MKMENTCNIRARAEVDAMLTTWADTVESLFDPGLNLFIDPSAKMRLAWRYKKGTANGSLHNGSQLSLYYAVSLFRLNRNLERASAIVEAVLDLQQQDISKPNYGNYRHHYELENPSDLNSIFFANFGLLVIATEHGAALKGELKKRIDQSFAISLLNIREGDEEANIAYTNASLGRIACGILIAERLGNEDMADLFLAQFEVIYKVNKARGIAERLSDTYYMVNIMAMAMILAYGLDDCAKTKAAELLQVFLRELRFFSHRQPLPARRTYNQEMGDAVKFTVLDWLLGDITTDQYLKGISRRSYDEEDKATYRMHTGWLSLLEPILRRIPEHLVLPFFPPEPRKMLGKLVDDSYYFSYYHSEYTLGSFSHYPTANLRHQHVSDMPIGFSGNCDNFSFLGMYAIDENGILHSNPGRYVEQKKEGGAHHGMPGIYRPAVIRSAAHQVNNLCLCFYDLDDLSAKVRELGLLLRIPQFTGGLCDGAGRALAEGKGLIPGNWCFIDHGTYYVALRALDHYDPVTNTMRPTSFEYVNRHGHLRLTLPNLKSEVPLDVACDNISAGLIVLCCSKKKLPLHEMANSVSRWKITEEWESDDYTFRVGKHESIRKVSVVTQKESLSMTYDYRLNRVLKRTLNDAVIPYPDYLCSVQPGGEELF